MRRTSAAVIVIILIAGVLSGFKETPDNTPYVFPELPFFPQMPVNPENPVTVEGAELGRHLFYDPVLSLDSTMSCASCHKQEFAFSDAPNQFSKGRDGKLTVRNTMPLFNLAWCGEYFWDGRAASIEQQVFEPVRSHDEMNLSWQEAEARINRSDFYKKKFALVFREGRIDSVMISKAIAQFLRTLLSTTSRYDSLQMGLISFTKEEADGFVLVNDMTKGDCLHCHTTDADALGTTNKFSNNGLDAFTDAHACKDIGRGKVSGAVKDYGHFRIPSLRNVALTAPYMHDGRFKTLEEVLDFYSDGVKMNATIDSKIGSAPHGGVHLTADEKKKVIAFLKALTDYAFVSDARFSNPRKEW
jgi:cytochrome c peroxidase